MSKTLVENREDRLFLHRRQRWAIPAELRRPLAEAIEDWRKDDCTRRLWDGDVSLWTGGDEDKWLGWLNIVEKQLAQIDRFKEFSEEVKQCEFTHILMFGMGGSCLCAEVLSATFGNFFGFPQLLVLDSTDPAQIRRVASRVDFRKTLFIVSSKSGTTLEVNLLKGFFHQEAAKAVGLEKVDSHFIAITDADSPLEQVAEAAEFRHIFPGERSIGGRFSALSNFGIAPAAAIGLDVEKFLTRAQEMVEACKPEVPVEFNPGVMLGLLLGVAGNNGRDKITLVVSPQIRNVGAWTEQMLAESTGKKGKGLLPVNEEELGGPDDYWHDRMFCYIRHDDFPSPRQDVLIDQLEQAGHPVVRIDIADQYDLGQEFYRWEFATAVAGSLLGVNPFNQPDVEAAKIATRELTERYESNVSFPPEPPFVKCNEFTLFADERNAAELSTLTGHENSVTEFLKAHLERLRPGDYFALLAFLEMNDGHNFILQKIRHQVRDTLKVPTSLGFGPRYLHSTGQLFKGGPNTGVFIQVTCDDAVDLPVPGRNYTFGIVKAAQARGDFKVLVERARRTLRVHIGGDVWQGLTRLCEHVVNALEKS